ncbi:cellulase family glycosylhydrolase [Paenibacillus sp. An7]|uniref:cellulase family glycosylhydrolase n=1 Tax=Paenibacillus sp. An7 TaxID=2689577 RepID=UPI001F3CCF26|nr:cellulase family glycosylhydrolase [Paenibacillus sp. An7]
MNNKKSFPLWVMLISLVLIAGVLFVVGHLISAEKQKEKKSKMQTYVEKMQPGWNLGNTFDAAGDETSWGNPRTTKELIAEIAEQGYNSIRIPITWKHRMGDAPDYMVDPDFMRRIEEVVDWSLDEGLYVMINIHHDSSEWVRYMDTNHDEVLERFSTLWTQIADHFKDHPNKLMFESINEPRFSEDWNKDEPEYFTMLGELNDSFHHIVRTSGGKNEKRPLVIPSITTSASEFRLEELYKTITSYNDPNLIATIHYYGFYPFSVNMAGATRFDEDAKKDIIDTFDRTYERFTKEGIPVIVGEFGLLGFDKFLGTIQQGEKLKYFDFVNDYATQKGFTTMLWDNGQHFNRREFQWFDEDLYAVIQAGFKGRSSHATSDLVYLKKGENVQDVSIPLELNGNEFQNVNMNGKTLIKGQDYTIHENILTLKANFLGQWSDTAYGKQAELRIIFNSGADWKLNIITCDVPELSEASGSSDELIIPVQFNGDELATMESLYENGRNAGPADWTSFKEFGHSFIPSYETNEIKLTKAFFNEIKDGKVILKFHFWSGEMIEYIIEKEGTSVTTIKS